MTIRAFIVYRLKNLAGVYEAPPSEHKENGQLWQPPVSFFTEAVELHQVRC